MVRRCGTLVFPADRAPAMGLTAITVICTVLFSLLFVFLDGVPEGVAAQGSAILPGLGAALLAGAVYVIPVMFLKLWSAQRLAPATLTFLLTAELLSGVVSSAIWLDEPFGVSQGLGAVLILAAAVAEVLKPGAQVPDR